MVDPKDRELDEGWLQEEPEAFKEAVLPLVDVQQNGFRDRKVLQKHRDAVVQYFTKTSSKNETLLLTKKRFICKVRTDDGYDTSEASESFERRCE